MGITENNSVSGPGKLLALKKAKWEHYAKYQAIGTQEQYDGLAGVDKYAIDEAYDKVPRDIKKDVASVDTPEPVLNHKEPTESTASDVGEETGSTEEAPLEQPKQKHEQKSKGRHSNR